MMVSYLVCFEGRRLLAERIDGAGDRVLWEIVNCGCLSGTEADCARDLDRCRQACEDDIGARLTWECCGDEESTIVLFAGPIDVMA